MLNSGIKKRKVSKKTKKSWRNVDNKDVEAYLDDVRFEERIGKPFSLRKDEDLFVVDRSKSGDLVNESAALTKQQRRELLKNKEPKCYAVLKPLTAVPDPISKRNRVRTREERINIFTKQKDLEKTVKRLQESKLKKTKSKSKPEDDTSKDVWKVEFNKQATQLSEWLTNDTKRHTLANTGKKQKRLPASLHMKPSVLPAVDAPHPGTSYNPSFADHQDLLSQIAADEVKLIKQEEHLNRVTNKMFRKVTLKEKDDANLKEMSEGLPHVNNGVEASEDEDNDPIVRSINPPTKRENKKTHVQRRKQKEQEQLKQQKLKQKIEKKKVADIYHLNQLKKQISKKQKKEEISKERKLKLQAKKALEPKMLSRNKFEPLEQEFQLGEELAGNLRNAQPAGNLLKDRFKSLQQRNIVAPSTVVLKKNKAKVKRYIKADHKIDMK